MTPARIVRMLAWAWCAASSASGHAADRCVAESGPRTRPLVELYTSEGCSSCPPADRWLAGTFTPEGPAAALAFHVDYWDRLGWPDRFARASWSARQQAIAQAGRSAVVYTPQVVVQGRDASDWRGGGVAREVARAAALPARAAIAVEAQPIGRRLAVRAGANVAQAHDRSGARLVVVYTDDGHVTDVRRGENAGVTLLHDHVVRALATSAPADAAGTLTLDTTIDLPADAGRHARLVAFVERHDAREVLQAVVLPLDRCVR
jgi:hypothetical protein